MSIIYDWLDRVIWSSVNKRIDLLELKIDVIEHQGDTIMATLEELTLKIADVNTAIEAERTEVQAGFSALRQQIADLQNAGGATSAELDALLVSLDVITAGIQNISEPAV